MVTVGEFFRKSGHFFSDFQNRAGEEYFSKTLFTQIIIYYKTIKSFDFKGYLGPEAVIFELLKIDKDLFYRLVIPYPCKEESFHSFVIVKFQT